MASDNTKRPIRRTKTMEIQAIRARMNESPPPPPAGTSVREWFAGLAFCCPDLMKDVPVTLRSAEAVRLADDLIKALATPRVPTADSMAAPSKEVMEEWEADIAEQAEKKAKSTRETVPGLKAQRRATREYSFGNAFGSMLPPPPEPPPVVRSPRLPAPSSYSSLRDDLTKTD